LTENIEQRCSDRKIFSQYNGKNRTTMMNSGSSIIYVGHIEQILMERK